MKIPSQAKISQAIALACAALVFTLPAKAALPEALATGNASLLPADSNEIVNAAIQQIDSYAAKQTAMLKGVYAAGAIGYAPGNRSQLIAIEENETVFPLLTGNKGNVLAAFGNKGAARFAAYGSAPVDYFLKGGNLSYEPAFKRVLGWLMTGTAGDVSSLSQIKNIALTNTGSTGTRITAWLSQHAPSWKTQVCNDAATIAACYQNKDVLIVSWETKAGPADQAAMLAAIKAHIALNKPVLYLHTWYEATSDFSAALSKFLGFSLPYGGNYWANDAAAYANAGQMQTGQSDFANIRRMLAHFKQRDYSFNWSLCTDDRTCKNMADLVSEFYNGAETVKNMAATWEKANLDIFSQRGRTLGKLLVLLGDKYRSGIRYPMTKGVTNDTTFLQALYADHAAYVTRKLNAPQPDLGSFSKPVPGNMPVQNAALAMTSQLSAVSSTSGFYAPPGRTITLLRNDASSMKAYVHIGMLRSGAGHIFDSYDRPLYLWGNNIPLVAGKPVTITTPYGGIVFLNTDKTAVPEKLSVAATGVMRQPVFNGQNYDEFKSSLLSTPLNWAEVSLPGIQIHSRLDLMTKSINDPLIGGNPKRLLDLTTSFLYEDIYSLAGMVGTGINQPAAVLAFCSAHGWDCTSVGLHGMTNIQHINADRANCGYGCSGNPYDQYWAYTPLGWGESHEIGHNLQRARLKIYDSASTEVSNNIFPTHKWLRFNQSTSESIKYGRDLGFKTTFNALSQAALSSNPVETAKNAVWVNGGLFQRLIFYWQMAMSSKDLAHLGDQGWDLFRLMYKHERLFTQAIASDANWTSQRTGLGFTQYPARPSSISGNDFMLISMSYITGRDQRAFFDLWGVQYSAEAAKQVASYGFPAVKKLFWVVQDEKSAFKSPLPTPVLVNGTNPWPVL